MRKTMWIITYIMLLIGIGIYSCLKPRNPNRVLKLQIQRRGIDYDILKPKVTYFKDLAGITDMDCEIFFDYTATNNELRPYLSKMNSLPITEGIPLSEAMRELNRGCYILDFEGDDFTLIAFDTLERKGFLYMLIM
ncbi:hypothetical protein [Alistipes sp.]|uniref:hypothetical protein n=1 Tax=Alistipes sp. TaxID=1872444 RepID=UPI003AB7CD88